MHNNAKLLFPLSLISAAILNVAPAIAQENIMLEEVVVTAQRREQSLQDVPVSDGLFRGHPGATQYQKCCRIPSDHPRCQLHGRRSDR